MISTYNIVLSFIISSLSLIYLKLYSVLKKIDDYTIEDYIRTFILTLLSSLTLFIIISYLPNTLTSSMSGGNILNTSTSNIVDIGPKLNTTSIDGSLPFKPGKPLF
jgi:hypothetical protein